MTAKVKLEDYMRDLDARKRERGYTGRDFVPVNSGKSRTAEKRALLRELERMPPSESKAPTTRTKA